MMTLLGQLFTFYLVDLMDAREVPGRASGGGLVRTGFIGDTSTCWSIMFKLSKI